MKKSLLLILTTVFCLTLPVGAATYYVATNGNDANSGSESAPFAGIQHAIDLLQPGDIIYLRGGTYSLSTKISMISTNNGTSGAYKQLFAYPGEQPVLDFASQEFGSNNRGIQINGSYWHVKGLEIKNAGDNGMIIYGGNGQGNYNIIENCVFHHNDDTGCQIGGGAGYNQVLNCDSYSNADPDYEDADGFAPKLDIGPGNYFYGCRAWNNSDDGWDMYEGQNPVVIENCWAFQNGYESPGNLYPANADKNGFKVGGNDVPAEHILRNCVAVGNGKNGFHQNHNLGSVTLYNCTSYNNDNLNYNFPEDVSGTNVFTNCISYQSGGNDRFDDVAQTTNSWQVASVSDADFVSLDWSQMLAPRKSDNTLPDIQFLHLASGSDMINAGTNVGIPYMGSAPDLGAFESDGTTPPPPSSYALTTNVVGQGTVSPSGGTYTAGSVVTLTATPSSGWRFDSWSGDASGTSTSTSITMSANRSVTANFSEEGTVPPPPPGDGDYIHNFTESGTSSSFYSISGNLSTSKGTVTYAGLTLTQCLKIESSTSITFTSSEDGDLTLVFNDNFNEGIFVDGTSYSASSGILTVSLAAGTHSITKDNVANLYYMSLSYDGTTPPPPATYTLSTGVSGSGTVSGAGMYAEGTVVNLSATASGGWEFSSWSGVDASNGSAATVNMNSNRSVSATFTEITIPPPSNTITIQENESGFCNVDGSIDNNNSGFTGDGFANTDNATGNGIDYKINVGTSGNYTVLIRYANGSSDRPADILQNGSSVGSISLPGTGSWTSWTSASTSLYLSSGVSDLRLQATTSGGLPNIDYITISGSGIAVSDCDGTTPPPPATYTLSTSVSGSGSLTGAGTYTQGTVVTLTASPASGWQVGTWSGADNISGNTATVTMNSNRSVSVTFTEIPPTTYTLSTSTNGSGSVSGGGTYNAGTVVSISATPSNGWQFDNWSGAASGTNTTTTVTVNSNISVTANFSEIPVGNSITLQENETGFCGVDGSVDNNNSGYTGQGFANTDNANGNGIDWAINGNGGTYTFRWRFANGTTTNRTGVLSLNGSAVSTEDFPGTGSWTTWTTTSVTINNVPSGAVQVRLEANQSSGLSNIDYMEVEGAGVAAASCGTTPPPPSSYTLTVNTSGNGSVSPGGGTYEEGTVVSLTATPGVDYIFSSWSGDASGTSSTTSITMDGNKSVTANFSYIGGGGDANFALVGWATEAGGTTGGQGGPVMTVSSGQALQDAINLGGPRIIYVTGTLTSAPEGKINVKDVSDISILGAGNGAELNGIGIKVWRASNIIIRNLVIHNVLQGDKDAISIEGPADHIWVDHCELYAEYQGVDKDYYDGLLDAKAESEYLTFSWNYLHDSWKTSLAGSSESDDFDRKMTLHHNWYRNCNSRLPLFRGGNGHIFNCLYEDIPSTTINSRIGACIRVENNYFLNAKNPWVSAYSDVLGGVDESGSILVNSPFDFSNSDINEALSCNAWVPYAYSSVLNNTGSVPDIVRQNAGVGKLADPASFTTVKSSGEVIEYTGTQSLTDLEVYPNPFGESVSISFKLGTETEATLSIYDMMGKQVDVIESGKYAAGVNEVRYLNSGLQSGVYFITIQTDAEVMNERVVIQ